jgi:hypothetical protein
MRRSRRSASSAPVVGLTLCVGAWVAVGVGFAVHVDIRTWTILVTVAAVATELVFWCAALMLGVTVFEARRKIWRAAKRALLGREDMRQPNQGD